MSSHLPHSYLTSHDCKMLNRVLANAGFKGVETEIIPGRTGDAARFVIDLFQTGIDSEKDLVTALAKRGTSTGDRAPKPVSPDSHAHRSIL